MPTAYTDATRKPVTRYAARIMCGTSYGTAALKITFSGSTLVTSPVAGEKPPGWFIHELTATTEYAPPSPVIGIGTPSQKCVHGARRSAEDVDRDEDRLEEEEDPLDREEHPEDRAEPARERRPEQAELERQHRAGHRTDRERHGDDLGPPPGQQQRVGVAVAQPAVVGDQHHRRERHPQRREDDVEPERERHLAPRRLEVRGQGDHSGHRPTVRRRSEVTEGLSPAGATRRRSWSLGEARRAPTATASPGPDDPGRGPRDHPMQVTSTAARPGRL